MIVIAKKFRTYVFLRNNHVPKYNFFPKEQSCRQREGTLSPSKTWLSLRAT